MSCEDCEKFSEEGKIYGYRWDGATIGIIACEKHFLEIIAKLQE